MRERLGIPGVVVEVVVDIGFKIDKGYDMGSRHQRSVKKDAAPFLECEAVKTSYGVCERCVMRRWTSGEDIWEWWNRPYTVEARESDPGDWRDRLSSHEYRKGWGLPMFDHSVWRSMRSTLRSAPAVESMVARSDHPPGLLPQEFMINHIDLREAIDDAMATVLNDAEMIVVGLRFGLWGMAEHSLEEIGDKFVWHRERVRQIEAKALRKLGGTPVRGILKPFWEVADGEWARAYKADKLHVKSRHVNGAERPDLDRPVFVPLSVKLNKQRKRT